MNSEKKEQIFKAFLSLAAVGTSLALAPAGPIGGIFKTLFTSLAPGWAAQFSVEAFMPWIKRKWLTEPNPLINHHINNSLILSWQTALDEVLQEYTEKKGGLHGKEAKELPLFINELKEISADEFLKRLNEDLNQEEIFKYLSPDNTQIHNYLNKRFDLEKKLDPFSNTYYLTQDFIGFFKERVPALMSFYFRADLKKGKEAKQAIDLLYHETIREAVNTISKKQEEQLRILNDLEGKINKLTDIDSFEYTALLTSVQSVQNEILHELIVIRENTIKIINALNGKPWLSYNDESDEPNSGTLFSYKQKYTSFTGREKELNDLQNFIDDNRKFCWLTILGPGGIGKSRLALEITEIARTQKFHSGFLDVSKPFNWAAWTPLIDTFIVIDYAYANYQEVFDLIKLFREKDKQKELNCKIRLLLLDRELREDWKKSIENNDAIRNSNILKNSNQKFYELQPLQDDERWQIIRDIINKSSLETGEKKELLKSESEIINKLNDIDPKQRPLFAFFTGVALIQENGMQNIENWNADDLIEHHLQRIEEGVWKKIEGYESNEDAVKKLILINTLCRELSAQRVRIIAEKLNIDSRLLKNYFLIAENKKNEAGFPEKYYGIQPDILGEYFILVMINEIGADPERDYKEWVDLYQYSVELDVKKVSQTFTLLNEDFKFYDLPTLPDLSKEQIAVYDKLIQKHPDNYFYFSERGAFKYNCGLYENALDDFNKSIELNSNNNISYYRRGLLYNKLGKFEDAILDFNVAIHTYADWGAPYDRRGYSKFKLDEFEDAVNDFNKAIGLEPDDAVFYNDRGNAYHSLKKYESAIEDYCKAIEINPNNFIFYRNRGGSKNQLEKYKDAITDINIAIELAPKDPVCYNERGYSYRWLGKFEEAVSDYSKAIELERYNADFYVDRGNLYYSYYRYQQAIEDYSKAIELEPNNFRYYIDRGLTYRKLNYYKEAICDYDKAIEADPGIDTAYLNRGIAKYLSNDSNYEEIISDYDKAVNLEKSSKNYFERALIKGYFRKLDEAIEDYNKAIEVNPKNFDFYTGRGNARMSLSNFEEAIEDYTKALELNSNDSDILYNRAYAKHSLGRYQEAIEDYTKAIEFNSNAYIYYNNRGLAQRAINNFEEAIEDYTKALELNSNEPDIFYNRAYATASLGKYEEAIEDYSKAIELNPNNFDYYNYRGLAQQAINNFEESIEDYTKALELIPGESVIFYNRAYAKASLGKYEEAIQDYSKAIELNPNNFDYYNYRGLAQQAINNFEEAIESYTKALELIPHESVIFYNRAYAKASLGKYEEAIQDYSKAIELNSNNFDYYNYRGLAQQAINNFEEAIEDYSKAIEIEPNEAAYYYNRAYANEALGLYEEAIEDYSKAIENELDNADYYNDRGYVKNVLGKYEEAITDFTLAIKVDPSFPNPYKHCAFSFYNLKQLDNALNNINKAISLNNNYAEAYTLRGKIYMSLNEKNLACEDFRKAMEMNDEEGKISFEKFCIN